MKGFNLKIWRGLNEHLALPISLAAVAFTGLSYCSERQDVAEQRAITQSVVWRSESLENDQGIKLFQPNEAVAVQRVEFDFPTLVRKGVISQNPSAVEIRPGWIEAGMHTLLQGCAAPNMSVVVIGNIPVNITTYYSVAGRNRVAIDTYNLDFSASVGEHGSVQADIQSVAFVGPKLATADHLLMMSGAGQGCLGRMPKAELQSSDP